MIQASPNGLSASQPIGFQITSLRKTSQCSTFLTHYISPPQAQTSLQATVSMDYQQIFQITPSAFASITFSSFRSHFLINCARFLELRPPRTAFANRVNQPQPHLFHRSSPFTTSPYLLPCQMTPILLHAEELVGSKKNNSFVQLKFTIT